MSGTCAADKLHGQVAREERLSTYSQQHRLPRKKCSARIVWPAWASTVDSYSDYHSMGSRTTGTGSASGARSERGSLHEDSGGADPRGKRLPGARRTKFAPKSGQLRPRIGRIRLTFGQPQGRFCPDRAKFGVCASAGPLGASGWLVMEASFERPALPPGEGCELRSRATVAEQLSNECSTVALGAEIQLCLMVLNSFLACWGPILASICHFVARLGSICLPITE